MSRGPRILPFPTPSEAPASERLSEPLAVDPPARVDVIGHRLVALRQTPWMSPVCIEGADGQTYSCQVVLALEAGHHVHLGRTFLRPWTASTEATALESLRLEEHGLDPSPAMLDQMILAAARTEGGELRLILHDGDVLRIADRDDGRLALDRLDPDDPSTRERLARWTDLWNGEPLLP